MDRYGATPDDWTHFSLLLGLTADLLPVVSNLNAKISPHSAMQGLGKTPSRYNGSRQVAGITKWTGLQSTNEDVLAWSKEPDYGICIQTRHVRAIDVDIEDAAEAAVVYAALQPFAMPIRARRNSSKFLMIFRCGEPMTKRRIKTAHGMIELLADGQQFVASGTHPSGERYRWKHGLPLDVPICSLAEIDDLWTSLETDHGVVPSTASQAATKQQRLSAAADNDPVALFLRDKGLVKAEQRDGRMDIECPWGDQHSAGDSLSSTSYWPAHTGGYAGGHFLCLHAHCEHRTDQEFKDAIGFADPSLLSEFEAIVDAPAVVEPQARQRFAVQDAAEFANRPGPMWLLKGVLPKAEVAIIYGDAASGKTFFTYDLMCSLARGAVWRGIAPAKRLRVVYVVAEGAGGFRMRIRAYAQHNGISMSELPGVVSDAPNMLEKADALDLAKAIIAAGGADLIVLDTLAQVTPGGNENSGEDIGRLLSHCRGLHRATGAMTILVHHSGKDADKGARGHSSLKGNADCLIEVERNGDARVATVVKVKDGEDGAQFGFRLNVVEVGEDEQGDLITSCVVTPTDDRKAERKKRSEKRLGDIQKLTVEVVGILLEVDDGTGIELGPLVEEIASRVPLRDGENDRRVFKARRAVDSLVEKGILGTRNGKIVSVEG